MSQQANARRDTSMTAWIEKTLEEMYRNDPEYLLCASTSDIVNDLELTLGDYETVRRAVNKLLYS